MSNLTPVAFDIETTGTGKHADLTVAGFAHSLGEFLCLNTAGRDVDDVEHLRQQVRQHSAGSLELEIVDSEKGILEAISAFASERLDEDRHYLTAYNGETWNGGFDLPFVRTLYIKHGAEWPFTDQAYVDVFEMVDRVNTYDNSDLVGVYDALVGDDTCDPFDDSAEAVYAFEHGHWEPLLLHNLADVQRTRELALILERVVPRSDFGMKNLDPPTT